MNKNNWLIFLVGVFFSFLVMIPATVFADNTVTESNNALSHCVDKKCVQGTLLFDKCQNLYGKDKCFKGNYCDSVNPAKADQQCVPKCEKSCGNGKCEPDSGETEQNCEDCNKIAQQEDCVINADYSWTCTCPNKPNGKTIQYKCDFNGICELGEGEIYGYWAPNTCYDDSSVRSVCSDCGVPRVYHPDDLKGFEVHEENGKLVKESKDPETQIRKMPVEPFCGDGICGKFGGPLYKFEYKEGVDPNNGPITAGPNGPNKNQNMYLIQVPVAPAGSSELSSGSGGTSGGSKVLDFECAKASLEDDGTGTKGKPHPYLTCDSSTECLSEPGWNGALTSFKKYIGPYSLFGNGGPANVAKVGINNCRAGGGSEPVNECTKKGLFQLCPTAGMIEVLCKPMCVPGDFATCRTCSKTISHKCVWDCSKEFISKAICNHNGVCDTLKGEAEYNCPGDCGCNNNGLCEGHRGEAWYDGLHTCEDCKRTDLLQVPPKVCSIDGMTYNYNDPVERAKHSEGPAGYEDHSDDTDDSRIKKIDLATSNKIDPDEGSIDAYNVYTFPPLIENGKVKLVGSGYTGPGTPGFLVVSNNDRLLGEFGATNKMKVNNGTEFAFGPDMGSYFIAAEDGEVRDSMFSADFTAPRLRLGVVYSVSAAIRVNTIRNTRKGSDVVKSNGYVIALNREQFIVTSTPTSTIGLMDCKQLCATKPDDWGCYYKETTQTFAPTDNKTPTTTVEEVEYKNTCLADCETSNANMAFQKVANEEAAKSKKSVGSKYVRLSLKKKGRCVDLGIGQDVQGEVLSPPPYSIYVDSPEIKGERCVNGKTAYRVLLKAKVSSWGELEMVRIDNDIKFFPASEKAKYEKMINYAVNVADPGKSSVEEYQKNILELFSKKSGIWLFKDIEEGEDAVGYEREAILLPGEYCYMFSSYAIVTKEVTEESAIPAIKQGGAIAVDNGVSAPKKEKSLLYFREGQRPPLPPGKIGGKDVIWVPQPPPPMEPVYGDAPDSLMSAGGISGSGSGSSGGGSLGVTPEESKEATKKRVPDLSKQYVVYSENIQCFTVGNGQSNNSDTQSQGLIKVNNVSGEQGNECSMQSENFYTLADWNNYKNPYWIAETYPAEEDEDSMMKLNGFWQKTDEAMASKKDVYVSFYANYPNGNKDINYSDRNYTYFSTDWKKMDEEGMFDALYSGLKKDTKYCYISQLKIVDKGKLPESSSDIVYGTKPQCFTTGQVVDKNYELSKLEGLATYESPVVVTLAADNITSNSAILRGRLDTMGGRITNLSDPRLLPKDTYISFYGLAFKGGGTPWKKAYSEGEYEYTVGELQPGKKYCYNAHAILMKQGQVPDAASLGKVADNNVCFTTNYADALEGDTGIASDLSEFGVNWNDAIRQAYSKPISAFGAMSGLSFDSSIMKGVVRKTDDTLASVSPVVIGFAYTRSEAGGVVSFAGSQADENVKFIIVSKDAKITGSDYNMEYDISDLTAGTRVTYWPFAIYQGKIYAASWPMSAISQNKQAMTKPVLETTTPISDVKRSYTQGYYSAKLYGNIKSVGTIGIEKAGFEIVSAEDAAVNKTYIGSVWGDSSLFAGNKWAYPGSYSFEYNIFKSGLKYCYKAAAILKNSAIVYGTEECFAAPSEDDWQIAQKPVDKPSGATTTRIFNAPTIAQPTGPFAVNLVAQDNKYLLRAIARFDSYSKVTGGFKIVTQKIGAISGTKTEYINVKTISSTDVDKTFQYTYAPASSMGVSRVCYWAFIKSGAAVKYSDNYTCFNVP